MESMKFIILGGGPTGIAAAEEAARFGADVTLVSGDAVGGRAAWSSLLPSKVLLTAAEAVTSTSHARQYSVEGNTSHAHLELVLGRIQEQAAEWSSKQKKRLEDHGVRVLFGKAAFSGKGNLVVRSDDGSETELEYDRVLIATGSVPVFFPSLKPDGERIIAPRLMGKLKAWPQSVIVIGGGVTGSEYAFLFNSIGASVTWVTDLDEVFPRADADIGSALEAEFAAQGVEILKSAPVESAGADEEGVTVTLRDGRVLRAGFAFIAIGRRADLDSLNLDAVNVDYNRAGVQVDQYGRSSDPAIYAAGDAAGPPYLVNRGIGQARAAVRSSMDVHSEPFNQSLVVEAVYTEPQIAQVGLTEKAAARQGTACEVIRIDFSQSLKGQLKGGEGFLKIMVSNGDHRILGAAAVGSGAAEILAPLAVAIRAGMSVKQLSEVYPAHPTLGELPFIAARNY